MPHVITKELLADVLGSRRSVKVNPNSYQGYRKIVDVQEYSVYERPLKGDKIVAAFGNTIVKKRGNTMLIYVPDVRIPWLKYVIKLNNSVFPGVYEHSKISQVLLLPYLRKVKQDVYIKDIRLCLFTDKGQIFHNKPARGLEYEGTSWSDDVIRFEESVIWDIPGRKYPTDNPSPDEFECYYPGLPSRCYMYSPADNKDPAFRDKYGNGGFEKYKKVTVDGKKCVLSRFYLHSSVEQANPFLFIGTGTRNDKVNLIGTYRANVSHGVRICIFASDDGGRQWYAKYEFSDAGEYAFQQGYTNVWGTNFGNKIALNIDLDCTEYGINICKRNVVLPECEDGSISTVFAWDVMSQVVRISGEGNTIVHTQTHHGLKTGNIIAFQADQSLPKQLEWFRCAKVNERGTDGGYQFKVGVIDDYSFEIFELISSNTPTLPCRHIHHINTLKDGWIVGTGEIYPNGWLLYIQQRMADTYSIVKASDPFVISRINTSQNSVQRTMGLIVKDTFDCKVIYASDHDTLERKPLNTNGLKNISRGSIGVFAGTLKDIDDRDRFECIFEATEPCYYFQQIGDMLVFAGQRGELSICVDPNSRQWHQQHLGRMIMHYFGQSYNYHFFNEYIILRK